MPLKMDERWLNCSFSDDFFACPLFSFSLLWYHSMAPDLLYKAFGLNATINARVCSIERSLDTIDKAIDNLELSIRQRNRGQAKLIYIFASGGQGVKREVGKLGKRGELELHLPIFLTSYLPSFGPPAKTFYCCKRPIFMII